MTRQFSVKIDGAHIGTVWISTDQPKVPNMKIASIVFVHIGGALLIDNLKLIPWIYIETISNRDIVIDLATKAGFATDGLGDLPND